MKVTDFLDADEAAETPRPLTVTSNSYALRWESISHDSEGPFDKLDEIADWDDIFVYGANYTKLDRPPDSKTLVAYKRPGAESDYSVKILKDNPHVAVVHSDMCDLPTGGKQKLTKARVCAEWYHNGDERAAATAMLQGRAAYLPAHVQATLKGPDRPAPHTNITEVPETTIMGDKPNPSEPGEQRSYIDLLADDEYRKLKAREIAKQRLIQEAAVGITLPEFYQLDEFLALPDTETPYLVNEIWPKGGHILIVAQQKAGKTTLRNNLAKSLCDGYDFLNRFQVHKPEGRIVILDLELPENMLRRWMRDCGIGNQQQLVVVPMRGKAASLNIGLPEVRAKWAQRLGRILRDPGLPQARSGCTEHV